MTPLRYWLSDASATQRVGQILGRSLPVGTVLLLQGNLGSGKTTLVQGLGAGLGITDPIASPTFTVVNEYGEGRLPLYHMDLYRLTPTEIAALGVDYYWDEAEVEPGIVAIEWAEKLPDHPDQYLTLSLCDRGQLGRELTLAAVGPQAIATLTQLVHELHQADLDPR